MKGVWLRYIPLTRRLIQFDEIERCEATDYQPLRQYGGWGIRGLGSNRAYNVSGSQGVRLHLRSGDVVVIGSQRAAGSGAGHRRSPDPLRRTTYPHRPRATSI